ncbi:hypothetical protein BBJ29_002358 [Phytophthora kernoviae]|uniref:Ubiquitin-like domain-containing protein n=1 Tax=Phytophthora kernoviae TaxID=325452 RepID=A0A3F2S3W6_9STRA|nr:hypothetical protein BBJ29_002358 [Phytophthora kernoviae]RLN69720.1 hypothetical protein BBP00_00000139 [Phytophthora kernoviae]
MDSPSSAPSSSPSSHDDWALVNDDAEIVASVTTDSHTTSPNESTHEEEGADTTLLGDEVPEGYLSIRLRQGEEIKPAWFKATQQVDDFIAKFFAEEIAHGKKIRLIYMGMLLLPTRSMGEYGIEENGVIHSVITDAPPVPHPQAAHQTNLKTLSPQNTLLILTGVFLYGLWTLFYYFPHFFTWKSIILLSVFSVMHMSAAVSCLTS